MDERALAGTDGSARLHRDLDRAKAPAGDRQRDQRARRRAFVLVGEQRRGHAVAVGADHHLVGGQQLHRLADHVLDDRPAIVEPRQLVGERIEAPQPLAIGERRRRAAPRGLRRRSPPETPVDFVAAMLPFSSVPLTAAATSL